MFCYHVRSSKGHHKAKESNADKNIIVRVYYGNYFFFGYCCVAQEVFYLLLYVLYFEPTMSFDVAGASITLQQVCSNSHFFLPRPLSDSTCLSHVSQLAMYATGPGFVFKQIANVGQMCSATDYLIKREFSEEPRFSEERKKK